MGLINHCIGVAFDLVLGQSLTVTKTRFNNVDFK